MFGFRALESGGTFESSFAVWMATLQRRGGQDAILESLQRVFPQLVDEESVRRLLQDTAAHARSLGYEKMWLIPGLLNEPLFAAAVKSTADHLGHPLLVVPTS